MGNEVGVPEGMPVHQQVIFQRKDECFAHRGEDGVATVRFDERTVVPVCAPCLELYEALDMNDSEVNVRVKEVVERWV